MEDVRPAFKPFYQVITGIQDSPTRPLCRLGWGGYSSSPFKAPFPQYLFVYLLAPTWLFYAVATYKFRANGVQAPSPLELSYGAYELWAMGLWVARGQERAGVASHYGK